MNIKDFNIEMIDELLENTIKEENEKKELFNSKYKDCFNAIIFNGCEWNSDQNLYSGLKAFQEIDKLVYIICDFCLHYNNKVNNNGCNECYLLYNNGLYRLETIYGQGTFSKIEYLGFKEDKNKSYNIKFEEVLKWVNETDEWRMFQKINKEE